MTRHSLTIALLTLIWCGCSEEPSTDKISSEQSLSEVDTIESTGFDTVQNLIQESLNYMQDRDFDGDGKSDFMAFDYSGGAHCCYKMSLKLSSMTDTIHYPFEMDGGYGFGIVDGSNHDQFHIADMDDDGREEIFMQISTYNGHQDPIKREWTKEYGITSNYIVFDYREGRVVVGDYMPSDH